MEKYGFIYIWYDKKNKKYYIGRHWGTEDDGYICSSNNMRMNYKNRPNDFKRRIVFKVTDKDLLILEEQRWLNMIDPLTMKEKYYNKTLKASTPSTRGFHHSDETKLKISAANKGKTISEETKLKISKSVSEIMTPEHRALLSEKNKGFKHSNEAKEKIRQSGIGREYNEETRRKIGLAQKGKIVSKDTRLKLRAAVLGKKRGPYKNKG